MLGWSIARNAVAILATIVLGGLLSATLVRLAPGFEADEQQLDPRLSVESVRTLRESRAQEHSIFRFYLQYINGAVHGELGVSHSLGQPVSTLLRERAPLTLRLVALGLLLSWSVAMAMALTSAWLRVSALDALSTIVTRTFLCIPAAVLALLSGLWNVPDSLAIALIVLPRASRYWRSLLAKAYSLPHITTARAKGLGELRVLFWHVIPMAAPQLLAVAGGSGGVALGPATPVQPPSCLSRGGHIHWH